MAIKWSALAVSEVMDKVEAQVSLAESFIEEAHRISETALTIPNLPEYMKGRLVSLTCDTEGAIGRIRNAIDSVRKDLPEKDLAREKERRGTGSQQSLMGD